VLLSLETLEVLDTLETLEMVCRRAWHDLPDLADEGFSIVLRGLTILACFLAGIRFALLLKIVTHATRSQPARLLLKNSILEKFVSISLFR